VPIAELLRLGSVRRISAASPRWSIGQRIKTRSQQPCDNLPTSSDKSSKYGKTAHVNECHHLERVPKFPGIYLKSNLSIFVLVRAVQRGPVFILPCRGWPFPDRAKETSLRLGHDLGFCR
jgi:hypothetical protein